MDNLELTNTIMEIILRENKSSLGVSQSDKEFLARQWAIFNQSNRYFFINWANRNCLMMPNYLDLN